MKRYHIILADPPWAYKTTLVKAKGKGTATAAHLHYNTMDLQDIKDLPIQQICQDNAVLFLWVTGPLLPQGMEVMSCWGFEYKTIAFTWIKLDGSTQEPFFGVGAYTKSNAELCLLGTKGRVGRLVKKREGADNPKVCIRPVSNRLSQVVVTTRRNNKAMHSVKPESVHRKIVGLFGDISRVELFARRKVPGWDVWGSQVKCDVELP